MVEARNGAGPIKSYPRPGSRLKTHSNTTGSGLQNKTFHCEICDVHVNSEIQLKQVCCLHQESLYRYTNGQVHSLVYPCMLLKKKEPVHVCLDM